MWKKNEKKKRFGYSEFFENCCCFLSSCTGFEVGCFRYCCLFVIYPLEYLAYLISIRVSFSLCYKWLNESVGTANDWKQFQKLKYKEVLKNIKKTRKERRRRKNKLHPNNLSLNRRTVSFVSWKSSADSSNRERVMHHDSLVLWHD